jgi:hypothetical protein
MIRTSRGARHLTRLRWLAALWAFAAPLPAADALANGRFPRAERLIEDPTDSQHLVLAATYGLLTTRDRGRHWYHVCETALAGDNGYAGDPLLELLAGGVQLVDVQAALVRSTDGCTWTPTLGTLTGGAGQSIDDFAVDSTNRSTVVAVVTSLVDGATSITLQESVDAGLTWRAIGTPLPVSMVLTIDLDPTNAAHIVATGLVPGEGGRTGVFLKSLDHGATWTRTVIPNTGDYDVPHIAAIAPQEPNEIFVRTDSWILPVGAPEEMANDALLYSSDGGASWTELLRKNAKLLGFALSPDGTTVLAGYGDPGDAAYYVDPTATGIFQASLSNPTFVSVLSGNVTCLTWTHAGTYVCNEEPMSGSFEELAFFGNGDLPPSGTPAALMRLNDLQGPPPCCAALASACDWTSICPRFNACPDSAATPPACVDAGNGGDAREVDAAPSLDGAPSVDATPTVDATNAGGSMSKDAAPTAIATNGSSACTCRVWGAPGHGNGLAGFCALTFLGAAASARRVLQNRRSLTRRSTGAASRGAFLSRGEGDRSSRRSR